MQKKLRSTLVVAIACGTWACGGSSASSSSAEPAPMAPDASSFTAHGLNVPRPDGWQFVAPDGSVAAETLVVIQGPFGAADSAPAVEISRRVLDARQQRRKPSHILTQLTMEFVQTFDGFEMIGQPEDMQVAGQPAAKILLKFTESMPDGQEIERRARFYGIVHRDSIWIITCLGASDGANDAEFDSIVGSMKIEA